MSDLLTSHPATPSFLPSKSFHHLDSPNYSSQSAVTFRNRSRKHRTASKTIESKKSNINTRQDKSTNLVRSITEPRIKPTDHAAFNSTVQVGSSTSPVAVSSSPAESTPLPVVDPTKKTFWKPQRSKSLPRDTSFDVSNSELSVNSDRQSRVTKSPRRKSMGTGMKTAVSGKIALLTRFFTRAKSNTGISNELKSCSLPIYHLASVEVLSQPPQPFNNETPSMLTLADAAESTYRPRQTQCAKYSRSMSEIREAPRNSGSISSSDEFEGIELKTKHKSPDQKLGQAETSFEESVVPIEQSYRYYDNDDNETEICRHFPLDFPHSRPKSRLPGDSLLKERVDSLIDAADAFTFGVSEDSSYDRAVEDATRETQAGASNQPLLYMSSTPAHLPLRCEVSGSGSHAGSPGEDRMSLCSTNTTACPASNKKKGVGAFIRRARSIGKSDRKKSPGGVANKSPGGVANKSMGAALSADQNGMATDSSEANLPLMTVGESNDADDFCSSAASMPQLTSYRKISMPPQPITASQARESGIAQLPATNPVETLPTSPTYAALPATPTNSPGIMGRLKRSRSLTRINRWRPKRRLSEDVTNTQS